MIEKNWILKVTTPKPDIEMKAIDQLNNLNLACYGFFSTEKPKQKASNSELKRWIDNGSVLINGNRVKAFDIVSSITEIILFPKSEKRRITFVF